MIDGTGVEVVNERVPVATERLGADRRQRCRECVERLLHRLVDRRAPVGQPGASALLQLRVDEPLRDGAGGKLEDGEGRAGGAAELVLGRRLGSEPDQLGEPDAARCRPVPELCQVGHGRKPELQPAGRKDAVGVAVEDGRADVLLPQDLERGWLGAGVGLDVLGYGHEPFRIRVAVEVAPDCLE